MPRFGKETQEKVDLKHANTSLALESSQALLKVPEAARLAMPGRDFFWVKNNFLDKGPYKAILRGFIPEFNSTVIKKLGKKSQRYFGITPDSWTVFKNQWGSCIQHNHNQSLELQSFNSDLTLEPMEWHWRRDRHISAFIWLDPSEGDIVEFPYLAVPPGEPPRLRAVAKSIVIFPSHPMYAFKFLESEDVTHYLEIHGTIKGCEKPEEVNSSNLE
jgi:hypothetical protein